uniref:Oplophorus-luciferin 2-monooxygenase non-catalytic subunit-like n=1 Tax=Hirondellea gigas TaxID=1518452 RepID=A0A6A7G1T7_9CRUS
MNHFLLVTCLLHVSFLSVSGKVAHSGIHDQIDHKDGKIKIIYSAEKDVFWPCPDPKAFLPCICTAESTARIPIMDMDCSDVKNQDELINAFNTSMSYDQYRTLTIQPKVASKELTFLNSESFGTCSFKAVHISGTEIIKIEDGTFDHSHDSLMILDLQFNSISIFPFESIANYLVLTELLLNSNKITIVEQIESKFLEVLNLNTNPGISFGSGLFVAAPVLITLDLGNCDLQNLTTNLFKDLHSLENLNLERNNIGVLEESSVVTPGATLLALRLNDNPITDIKRGGIKGMSPDGQLFIQNALIKELTEEVWEPVARILKQEAIKMSGNPLRCGCDLEWMFLKSETYYTRLESTTTCSDGYLVYDINPDVFDVHCN